MTAWSEHARHYILTSDFAAALISETHLRRDKLVSAATEARKSSWAGTGSAAISTANNGANAGVLASVRTPLSICTDEAGVFCPNPRLAERVIRVMGREMSLLTALVSAAISMPIRCTTCVFSREMGNSHLSWERTSISHPACGKTCLFVEAASGSTSWEHRWSLQWVPHTRASQAGVKSLASSIVFWCHHSFGL